MAGDTVHLLLFELAGQLYGVDVDQVEAIVAGECQDGEGGRFCSYEGEDVPVHDLARWIGLDQPVAAPRVLLSRSSGTLQGFVVDAPKDIVTLELTDIFPMPNLIQRALGPSPLWGVGRSSSGLLLLVDLARGGTR